MLPSPFPILAYFPTGLLYEEFQGIIDRLKAEVQEQPGVEGEIKNIIFAANGPKPEIVLTDSLNNNIEIRANREYCLVYDLPIPDRGLLWSDFISWWQRESSLNDSEELRRDLKERLVKSLASEPEKLLFETYMENFYSKLGDNLPVLIPQVYLHYDPKTVKELKGSQRLSRQRMDFLLLFSNKTRIVVEVDGKQHYAEEDKASPKLYADMVSADRELRLFGYEVYRFGGHELFNKEVGKRIVIEFFQRLLYKHGVITFP